jgi:ADP-heptose:LPS heptosyltransferase/lauroyl/myristoyl acyltransferase
LPSRFNVRSHNRFTLSLNFVLFLLKIFGRLCALVPEVLVRAACVFIGLFVWLLKPQRAHSTLKNLHHAFPDKSERWRRRVFRESCARMVEMALYLPASAYLSDRRLNAVLEMGEDVDNILSRYIDGDRKGHPVALLLPHMTLSEACNLIARKYPNFPALHAIYRPLNQQALNEWLIGVRARFGTRMISRRDGYNGAMAALRNGGAVVILFDQDASKRGTTITFMDRIVSATDLPGLMVKRFDADAYLMMPERIGFWKSRLSLQALPKCQSATELSVHSHRLLDAYLHRDFDSAADWLWLHNRWNFQYSAHKRFSLPSKRNQLELSNQMHGYDATPRKTRLWVRMPNWLGDVVMALPILRAIREGRPDFEISLIGKAGFRPLFDLLGIADRFIELPPRGCGYFNYFYKLRLQYPDTYLLFTNSTRGDLEAFLTRCPQRFSMVRPGKRRPLLTHPVVLPENLDETQTHQTHVWEWLMRRYDLKAELDYTPLQRKERAVGSRMRIGLICGTENAPEKRWPIAQWRTLIGHVLERNPGVEVVLFGTSDDRSITNEVAAGFAEGCVRNLAGQTDLAEFCEGLKDCDVVACNDTGGLHLANMLGTPVIAVFGPTNPVRTGPIFAGPAHILQPDGCPATGGFSIDGVTVDRVLEALQPYVEKSQA